jgi:4-carboxymuconolactone decarboxylase
MKAPKRAKRAKKVSSPTDVPTSELYRRGNEMRYTLLGREWVEKSERTIYADPTMRQLMNVIGETVFGTIWTRPGLDLKTRTIVVIATDVALGKPAELAIHIRMALRQGWTEQEIIEVLLQLTAYAGVVKGREAFLVAQKVFREVKEGVDSRPEKVGGV